MQLKRFGPMKKHGIIGLTKDINYEQCSIKNVKWRNSSHGVFRGLNDRKS